MTREEELGRAIYLAMYEKDGAKWEANHHQDLWVAKAQDYERRRGHAQQPLREAIAKNEARWQLVFDLVTQAREAVRLKIPYDERPPGLFQALQDAFHVIGGRENLAALAGEATSSDGGVENSTTLEKDAASRTGSRQQHDVPVRDNTLDRAASPSETIAFDLNDPRPIWEQGNARPPSQTQSNPKCLNCGRAFNEHSFNTRDTCNFFIADDDDVQSALRDREADGGGAGQGGLVSGHDARLQDLRGVAASAEVVSSVRPPSSPSAAPDQKDLPTYPGALARDYASQALSDIADDRLDDEHYSLARWFAHALDSARPPQADAQSDYLLRQTNELVERLEAMERGHDVHIPLAKVIGQLKRLLASHASPQQGQDSAPPPRRQRETPVEILIPILTKIIESYDWCSADPIDRGYSVLDSDIHVARIWLKRLQEVNSQGEKP